MARMQSGRIRQVSATGAGLFALVALLLSAACSSVYYSTLESFGVAKREVLAERVADGREDQQEAREQFESALEAFKSVTDFQGGSLEAVHGKLSRELDRCEESAATVTRRIASIEDVARHLFEEWEQETQAYQSAALRRQSEELLADTQRRYAGLLDAMRRAEQSMQPVLAAFRDHVLFLKHNLNAQAVAALVGSDAEIEGDVARLVQDMEASIAEADAFIAALG